MREGLGSLVQPNGPKKFVGQFKDDYMDGEGVLYSYFDGSKYLYNQPDDQENAPTENNCYRKGIWK